MLLYRAELAQIGPEIANDAALNARVKFKPYRFDNHNKAKTENNPETHTLDYMMNENGHTFIDLLKIDVEGSRYLFHEYNAVLIFHRRICCLEANDGSREWKAATFRSAESRNPCMEDE